MNTADATVPIRDRRVPDARREPAGDDTSVNCAAGLEQASDAVDLLSHLSNSRPAPLS